MVSININTQNVVKALRNQAADMKWVNQNLVNDLLKGARTAQETHMRSAFTIRNQSFLKNSLKITKYASRANPSGTLAMVDIRRNSQENLWSKFESGGTKRSLSGKNVAVPTRLAWPNRGRALPTRNRPRNLTNSFVVKDNGNSVILQRTRRTVKPMYTLVPQVRIPPLLRFEQNTSRYINSNVDSTFNRLLDITLRKNNL